VAGYRRAIAVLLAEAVHLNRPFEGFSYVHDVCTYLSPYRLIADTPTCRFAVTRRGSGGASPYQKPKTTGTELAVATLDGIV